MSVLQKAIGQQLPVAFLLSGNLVVFLEQYFPRQRVRQTKEPIRASETCLSEALY
jgi:hypothetical protein